MGEKSWQKHKYFSDGVHPLRCLWKQLQAEEWYKWYVKMILQNKWNNTSTQLNATSTLYQKEKKWCCPILEGIFSIRNIDKIIRKGFFFLSPRQFSWSCIQAYHRTLWIQLSKICFKLLLETAVPS